MATTRHAISTTNTYTGHYCVVNIIHQRFTQLAQIINDETTISNLMPKCAIIRFNSVQSFSHYFNKSFCTKCYITVDKYAKFHIQICKYAGCTTAPWIQQKFYQFLNSVCRTDYFHLYVIFSYDLAVSVQRRGNKKHLIAVARYSNSAKSQQSREYTKSAQKRNFRTD